jgi:hypothetical protein
MTNNTIFCALALIGIGLYAYLGGTPEPETGSVSKTALIPAFFGAALMLCAVVVILKESLRKHVMHLAAMIGLLGAVGGLMPIYRQTMVKNLPFDASAPAVKNGLYMTLICAVFVGLCVKSFIDARKAREAAAKAG